MNIFHYQEVEAKMQKKELAKLKVRWLITKEIGAENFAMRMLR